MNQGDPHNPTHGRPRPAAPRRIVRTAGKRQAPGTTPATTFRRPAAPGRGLTTTPAADTAAPHRLRLVGDNAAPDMKPPVNRPTPIAGPTDPRWVLAVRTADRLQGSILPPEDRDRLTRLGKAMGLTPFDCALILAIVQDQARRGLAPAQCLIAGEPQLALIPLPTQRTFLGELRDKPLQIATLVAAMLALQGMLMWMWLS